MELNLNTKELHDMLKLSNNNNSPKLQIKLVVEQLPYNLFSNAKQFILIYFGMKSLWTFQKYKNAESSILCKKNAVFYSLGFIQHFA